MDAGIFIIHGVGFFYIFLGDHDVVDPGHFTSESAQILIGEIMGCNRDLENIQKNINDVKNKRKIIDNLGRV